MGPVLCDVARRLSSVARASDTVDRLGGYEFVVVMHDARSQDDAATLSNRILNAFREVVVDSRWHISVSIGIVASGRDGLGPAQLPARADEAMFSAKIDGGDRDSFCGESTPVSRIESREWSEALCIGIPEIDTEHERLARQMSHIDDRGVGLGVRYLADWLNRHASTFDADMAGAALGYTRSQRTGDP